MFTLFRVSAGLGLAACLCTVMAQAAAVEVNPPLPTGIARDRRPGDRHGRSWPGPSTRRCGGSADGPP